MSGPAANLAKLFAYLQPYWGRVAQGVAALLVVNLLSVWIPLLVGDAIDRITEAGQLLRYVVAILVLASLMWVIRMLSRIWLFGIGRRIEYDLKQKIFSHLLCLEPAYFATNPPGDLISRATSDVENVRRLFGFAILSLANTFFAYIITLPVMLAISVPLSLVALIPYPLISLVVHFFSERLRNEQQEVQEGLSDLSDLIQEDMSGIAPIKIYAQEESERREFARRNDRLLDANLRLAQTRNVLFPSIEGMASLSLLGLLYLGAQQLAQNGITPGSFIELILLAQRLTFPVALLGFTITAYQRGEVSLARVEAILSVPPQIADTAAAADFPIADARGHLQAKSLSYHYSDNPTAALAGVDFVIKPGETVAIVGAVGAGKTTLANALPRLLDIGSGQLFLDDRDITHLKLQDLRRAIAYVPQESFLFSATIADNIAFGCPESASEAIERAAQTAQIHSEILNFPRQYATLVGERGITLSGGQRQRAALARALLMDAPVLILDDALSSVDNQTATRILANLSKGIRRKTVLFISHQLAAAARADRILVMDRGRIVQNGTHQELCELPGPYRQLWEQHQLETALR
ncbi:MAG: ABC transporter ATP-binding protein [Cyanobacteria bacterium J06641_5]